MIGDESMLREAVIIKEQNKLKLKMQAEKKGTMAMKRLTKENEQLLNSSIIKPGILEQVIPSIGTNRMAGGGGLSTLTVSDSSGTKINTSSSQFSKM